LPQVVALELQFRGCFKFSREVADMEPTSCSWIHTMSQKCHGD
jgi:hypothetical protein